MKCIKCKKDYNRIYFDYSNFCPKCKKEFFFLFMFLLILFPVSAFTLPSGTIINTNNTNYNITLITNVNTDLLNVTNDEIIFTNITGSACFNNSAQVVSYIKSLGYSNTFVSYGNGTKTNFLGIANIPISINDSACLGTNGPFIINSETFNSTSYETARETFTANIDYDSSFSSISVNLIYDGDSYSTTQSSNDFTVSLDIPLSESNNSLYWQVSLTNSTGTTSYNSETSYQYINSINFNQCNSTFNNSFINYTFIDETSGANVNGTIVSAIFQYYLGSGNVIKTLVYPTSSSATSIPFCFTPIDRSVSVTYSLSYSGTGYQPRITNPPTSSYSSTTTNQNLYLLGVSDGVYASFMVKNLALQTIQGATIICSRYIGTDYTAIAEGTTGDDGIVQFWLNPQYLHYCHITADGYVSQDISIYPTQGQYSITMASSSQVNDTLNDYNRGVLISISPINQSLMNNTIYNFTMTLNSTVWDIDSFGFYIMNVSGYVLGQVSSTSNGGTVTLSLNTGNNSRLILNYYYELNNEVINGTKVYYPGTLIDTEWSIRYFFEDLKRFMTSGIFGLDNFGLTLIVFFIIFIFVGVMTFKYGFGNGGVISLVLFALIFLFDITLNMLPNFNGIPIVTIFAGLFAIIMVIREWIR